MISHSHKEKVLQYLSTAKSEGAKFLLGDDQGGLVPSEGNYVAPVILDNCDDSMTCVREEIFGPVMSLLKFADDYEVLERANATDYGLAGGVFTADMERARRFAQELQVGICWINSYNITPVEVPFNGIKQSGVGLENGIEVLDEYTQNKTIYTNASGSYPDFFE